MWRRVRGVLIIRRTHEPCVPTLCEKDFMVGLFDDFVLTAEGDVVLVDLA